MGATSLRLQTIADEDGQPVAVIVPLELWRKVGQMLPEPLTSAPRGVRPLGLANGQFAVPAGFFDPLPDEMLDAFEGREAS